MIFIFNIRFHVTMCSRLTHAFKHPPSTTDIELCIFLPYSSRRNGFWKGLHAEEARMMIGKKKCEAVRMRLHGGQCRLIISSSNLISRVSDVIAKRG